MQFNIFGSPESPKVLLLHGTAMTWKKCFEPVVEVLSKKFFLIIPALNGHNPNDNSVFSSVEQETKEIEEYLVNHYDGQLHAAYGFSMGGTVLINLLSKGTIQIDKVILDAAFCAPMGMFAGISADIMTSQLMRLKRGKGYNPIIKALAGGDEESDRELLYMDIDKTSIKNATISCYRFTLSKKMAQVKTDISYWHGSKEPFASKSAGILSKIFPDIRIKIFDNFGHGELIIKHPQKYILELNQIL